jgi:hypothetical protein
VNAAHKAILIALIIAGCGGPGAPLLRTGADDGDGPLIEGCHNVSSAWRADKYITDFYLSTWGSALVEGSTEGFGDGVRDTAEAGNEVGKGIANFMGISGDPSEMIYHLPVQPSPYCKAFAANPQEVSRVVASILPMLGNDIRTADETNGLFVTGPIERRHLMARWRDSYEISVMGESANSTVVRVLRKLYISRSRNVFNQAISVGHNEAWILTQIGDKLNEPGRSERQ